MNLKFWLGLKSIVVAVFALAFIILPKWLGSLFGMDLNDAGVLLARFFGMAWVFEAVLLWLAKNFPWPEAQKIVIAGFISNVLGLALALMATLGGVMNGLGWLTVVLFLLFAVVLAYFLFFKKSV